MGFRFFRRIKLLPGVTLNLSRSGPSVSLGPRGLKTTIGPRGEQTTVGLPGTGLSYTEHHGGSATAGGGCGCLGVLLLLAVLAGGGFFLARGCDRPESARPPIVKEPTPRPEPVKASERLVTAGLVVSLAAKDSGSWRLFVTPAFRALASGEQLSHLAALWRECFGPPPGDGILLVVDNDSGRTVARFGYRDGRPELRRTGQKTRPASVRR